MNILYVGDVMGQPGIEVLRQVLPDLRKEKQIDLIIVQAENVTEGRGISTTDYEQLKAVGVDVFAGGNWSLHRKEIHSFLDDPMEPIVRPANYLKGTPGQQWKYVLTPQGKVLIISLLGQIVGKDADQPMEHPLKVIDDILEQNKGIGKVATVVNFHGDFSSEKVVIGYYLDGRVSAVIGDHWHVPTADAMVLPNGTAHISDVGMCGVLHSSLGVKLETIIDRWKNGKVIPNELEKDGPLQFNAVLVSVNTQTGLARSIEQIQRTLK